MKPLPWSRRPRPLRWLMTGAALILFLGAVPVSPYRAACYDRRFQAEPIQASLRPVAVGLMSWILSRRGIVHLRLGPDLYLPLAPILWPLGWRYGHLAEDSSNTEWKIALSIVAGSSATGGGNPVPAAVERLIVGWEARHGEPLPRNAEGYPTSRAMDRLPDCALRRAALTVADDTPEERAAQGRSP